MPVSAAAPDLPLIQGRQILVVIASSTWARNIGEVCGRSVRQTADGGYIIAGLTEGLVLGEDNAWMLKTDSDGVLQWSRVFGGGELDCGTSVLQTADGSNVLAGDTHSSGAGDFDAGLIRTDGAGYELWSRTYGGGAWYRADAIEATGDGGCIIAGMTKSIWSRKQAWLIKIDGAGAVQWSQDFGGEGDEWGGGTVSGRPSMEATSSRVRPTPSCTSPTSSREAWQGGYQPTGFTRSL